MYLFCQRGNLRDVWAYLWNQWYSPKMWPLWARSASPLISRLRTTMNVENFWRQLKHDFLHHLLRPRADQLTYILRYQVLPSYLHRADILEDGYRAGRSRPLTTYQKYFKKGWEALTLKPASGRAYNTDIRTWTCNCGAQKFNTHHLCKHLVQATAPLPMRFWREVVRRRTMPLYEHRDLKPRDDPECAETPLNVPPIRSITNGDDHDDEIPALPVSPSVRSPLGTVPLGRTNLPSESTQSSTASARAALTRMISAGSGAANILFGEENVRFLRKRADDLEAAARLIRDQLPYRNPIWLRSLAHRKVGEDVAHLVRDIRHVETTGRTRDTTWPRAGDAESQRRSRNTMGYQIRARPAAAGLGTRLVHSSP
ncbi:hypothetical protein BV25DRAFT_1816378 [Artomyces pyxidatus]|uniref:Uncharacterized protein n=1 Tax=Artomyces pyxidatus TaxID=48021 RepID=A0ACB8SGS6_9AGAM|nr:hypothetical protein BV25DRAFT_1816378 [Artomyces pyxidatus]